MRARLLITLIASVFAANAYGKKLHSSATTQVAFKLGKPIIMFKVKPAEGLVINDDENTRWKVQIKESEGLKEETYEMNRDKFNSAIPGFALPVELKDPEKRTFSARAKLISFVCSEDKSRCYRDVLEDIKIDYSHASAKPKSAQEQAKPSTKPN